MGGPEFPRDPAPNSSQDCVKTPFFGFYGDLTRRFYYGTFLKNWVFTPSHTAADAQETACG